MAITPMAKVMIVCHRTQVSDLPAALQAEGIRQILNADEAAISKDTPELAALCERPKDLEEPVARLEHGASVSSRRTRRPRRAPVSSPPVRS